MKRQLPQEGSTSSGSNEKKIKREVEIEIKPEFPLEQGKLYFTPIGGITTSLINTEDAMGFSDIIDLIRPSNSMHFTFEIDFEWVISCYPPSIRSTPITLVVGDNTSRDLQKAAKNHPNVTVVSAHLPIPYGTHHSKLSILENDRNVHVIVSTANLVTGDWEFKTQQFYHACGDKTEGDVSSPFQQDLLEYLSYYGKPMDLWKDKITKVDFSGVQDRLVFSVPGYHRGEKMKNLGHPRLRRLLAEMSSSTPNDPSQRPLYVAQCSSIGSLGKTPATWLRAEFLHSLEGPTRSLATAPARLFVIYPTVENVKQSCQGYEAGCSLPYRDEVHQRQNWMDGLFCKWRSDNAGRTKAMPHAKSYVKIVDQKVEWQVVTSANLSKAAWGEYQKTGTQLCIRSYEIGVLIRDPERVKLPYDYPIVRYQSHDKPWTTDIKHMEPDIFGQQWIHGK